MILMRSPRCPRETKPMPGRGIVPQHFLRHGNSRRMLLYRVASHMRTAAGGNRTYQTFRRSMILVSTRPIMSA